MPELSADSTPDRIITERETAEILGISPDTLRRLSRLPSSRDQLSWRSGRRKETVPEPARTASCASEWPPTMIGTDLLTGCGRQ